MSETPSISPTSAASHHRHNGAAKAETTPARESADGRAASQDRLELSDRAVLLSKLRELPAVRADLVQRVRDQIDTGAYETPDKLDRAVLALMNELGGDA